MAALLGVVPPARADYLPVANPTKSFWLTENDLANEGRDAVLPDDILDVAVIGSGISGCSVAYHLSLTRNLKIAMFEARDFCGGATGRNGGHLTASGLLSFPSHLQSFGSKEAIKCVELQQRCVSGLLDLIHENGWASGVDLQQGGSVFLCETSEEAQLYKTAVKEAAAAGLDVSPFRWLDSEAIEKKYHASGFVGGMSLPGNTLWPLKLVTRLFRLARKQLDGNNGSLSLFTHTPVTVVTADGDSWVLHTDRGTTRARQVIHCTNAYAAGLVPEMSARIVPCRGQMMAIRPDQALWTSSFGAIYGFEYLFQRPTSQASKPGLIMLGGSRNAAKPPCEMGELDDSKLNEDVTADLASWLPRYFPSVIPQADIEFSWSGIMGFTPDSEPVVSELPSKHGQWISAGFSGHGMSRAFAAAEALAVMILQQREGKSVAAPTWMPRHYLLADKRHKKAGPCCGVS